jgi:spermidine synthase
MTTLAPSRRCLLVLALLALLPWPAAAQRANVVYEVRSPFQTITVWDSPDGTKRQMIFDAKWDGTDAIQSELNKRDPLQLVLPYAQYMITSVPLVEKPKRILIVGLGGACLQRYLHNLLPETVIESAELDPAVLDVARRFFALREDARQIVHIGDGRKFIEQTQNKYDIIMLDAFSATSIPYPLATQEFVKLVKSRLAPGGLVCANLWYNQKEYHDMIKTYDSVFPEWYVLRCPEGWTNQIVVAFPERRNLTADQWIEKARAFARANPQTRLDLPRFIDRGLAPVTRIPTDAVILLDKDADKHK